MYSFIAILSNFMGVIKPYKKYYKLRYDAYYLLFFKYLEHRLKYNWINF